jgi:hypothetical protein
MVLDRLRRLICSRCGYRPALDMITVKRLEEIAARFGTA